MKKWKRNTLIFLLIIAIIVGVFFYTKYSFKNEMELLSNTIEEQLSKILELSTVKYNYTNVVSYKDSRKLSGLNLPFTSKSFLIKYDGYIKAGVDLNTVETEITDTKSIKMTLDKPKVFDNVIIEEEVYVYDEKDSIFNKLSFENLYEVLIEEKQKMEKEVVEKGLLNDAEKNTKEMLISLLKSMGFEKIEIVFRED
ncbi:DUF4230 domain-containing protein [Clostridium cochlearium]|uniref:DUF4230 domain-containing protein n=1 Tax=Clostridium cochlearium TaxID=1494 RepID=UPI00181970C2|nr:DUF4230 domain-containing protein [Clostridium cochlearium]NMA58941.1 DUF4230 domain-containing protein [Clostridium cochlearium]